MMIQPSIRIACLALAVASIIPAQEATKPITLVGEFSNVRVTGLHNYGYTVQLWRDDDKLFGLLLVSDGLPGDEPTGLLEDIKFDPATHAISFSAKLSVGVRMQLNRRREPSHDLFEFTGTLEADSLNGSFQRNDPRLPRDPRSERVELAKRPPVQALPLSSYADWKTEVDAILKRRGPKW